MCMTLKVVGRVAALVFVFSSLSACENMNTMISPGDIHRVSARVDGISLESEASIIRSGDRIYPYFVAPVENDPDVTGLLAYLVNMQGEVIGQKTRFVLATARLEGDFSGAQVEVGTLGPGLPPFYAPEGMSIGRHYLIFEALGGRGVLCRTEIPVFYISDANFSLTSVSVLLPGMFGTRVVPLGTTVLLEAQLEFDDRLDPYLVWSNGGIVIHEGRMREGAGSVLWETPSQVAFHSIRLEVFPTAASGLRRNLAGASREISLPVSAAGQSPGVFFGAMPGHPARGGQAPALAQGYEESPPSAHEAGDLLRWHRFEGNLSDAAAGSDEGSSLVPTGATRWVSAGQAYGLSAGADDAFYLPLLNFFGEGQTQGGGVFLSHVMTLVNGTIFSVFFPPRAPAFSGAWLDLTRVDNELVLRVGSALATAKIPAPLSERLRDDFIPIAVTFGIHSGRLEASLSVGEGYVLRTAAYGVDLDGALSGAASARLGGVPLDFWVEEVELALADYAESRPETQEAAGTSGGGVALGDARADSRAAAIWSEFAVLLSHEVYGYATAREDAQDAAQDAAEARDASELLTIAASE